jgi:hypothetical protein
MFYIMMFSHLEKNKMTYIQHMIISLNLSMIFCISSITAFIHAFFPFLFETSSSDTIKYADTIINHK